MINTAAELLSALIKQERQRLGSESLKHGPTIGDMYEGLAAHVLARSLPLGLDLRVRKGFIVDGLGGISGQIDCMLVRGQGEPIPYTDSFRWHVKDVLAVFEIKKTLYGAELRDSISHLGEIRDLERRYLQTQRESKVEVNLDPALRAFAETTGKVAPGYDELNTLPLDEQLIFHTLVGEFYGPLRIVFGYDGYKSEASFRSSIVSIIENAIGKRGYGVGSFPQLIISGGYSVIKANGQPYSAPVVDGYWHFYLSSPENPLRLLLEVLWTKLENAVQGGAPWGDDLDQEVLHPFLSARGVQQGDRTGWMYQFVEGSTGGESVAETSGWSPEYLDEVQFSIVKHLCDGLEVRLDDPELVAFLHENGTDVEGLLQGLAGRGLVARDGHQLRLITRHCTCVVLPSGELVAAENNTGRLDRWLQRQDWSAGDVPQ